jgi:hypothetical protein
MVSEELLKTGKIFAYAGVRQDKATPSGSYASHEEAQDAIPPRSERPKHHGSQKRRGRKGNCYLSPQEWDVIDTLRGTGGNRPSEMAVVSDLVRKGLRLTIENQHAEVFEPRIEKLITNILTNYMNRTDSLLAKDFYAVEALRIFIFKMFHRYVVADSDLLEGLYKDAEKEAGDNIKTKI